MLAFDLVAHGAEWPRKVYIGTAPYRGQVEITFPHSQLAASTRTIRECFPWMMRSTSKYGNRYEDLKKNALGAELSDPRSAQCDPLIPSQLSDVTSLLP